MPNRDLADVLAQLDRFHLKKVPHAGQSLLQHLIGTYRLLAEWGERDAVCLAGLCHSVYGTEVFRARTIPLSDRTHIATVIGGEAEQLAYLFCAMRRASLWENLSRHRDYELADRITGIRIPLTEQELRDLVAVSLANLLDQRPHLGARKSDAQRDRFLAARHLLSDIAYAAVLRAYEIGTEDKSLYS